MRQRNWHSHSSHCLLEWLVKCKISRKSQERFFFILSHSLQFSSLLPGCLKASSCRNQKHNAKRQKQLHLCFLFFFRSFLYLFYIFSISGMKYGEVACLHAPEQFCSADGMLIAWLTLWNQRMSPCANWKSFITGTKKKQKNISNISEVVMLAWCFKRKAKPMGRF